MLSPENGTISRCGLVEGSVSFGRWALRLQMFNPDSPFAPHPRACLCLCLPLSVCLSTCPRCLLIQMYNSQTLIQHHVCLCTAMFPDLWTCKPVPIRYFPLLRVVAVMVSLLSNANPNWDTGEYFTLPKSAICTQSENYTKYEFLHSLPKEELLQKHL